MNKKLIRKMLTAAGGPIYEKDWSDKVEPYAAGIGLAGDAIGLGAATTGIGIPVGAAIAGFANVPNLIIDGYLTARDTWRSFNDGGNSLGSAVWNGGEFLLDTVGLKALQYINKAAKAGVASEKYLTSTEKALDSKPWKRVGTGHGRVRARQSADHKRKYNSGRNKALEESNIELAKRGVRPALGLYYQQKLTDEMAKRGYGVAVNDAIKSANRTLRQNLGIISGVSGGTNVYHLLPKHKSGGQVRKMQTASGGPINWLRKRIYTNIEPFGYNDVGSRLINAIVLNKNEHDNFKGDYSDPERTPALYLTLDNIWGEYLHIPKKERRYFNGKYKIKNNGNGTFSLPFESMKDILLTVNSNNPLLWGLRGKALNSVVGEYDIYRGYDKNGDYLKYTDHWRINPYDVKEDKEYGLDNNSLLNWYFKGKDDASFGLGTPVEIQGKYYLDDIYNVKGKDRGGHYLPEIIVTGKKKQGGKMNILEFLKNGSGIHIKEKNKGKFTKSAKAAGLSVQEHAKSILNDPNATPLLKRRANFARNAAKWKHEEGGIIQIAQKGIKAGLQAKQNLTKRKDPDWDNLDRGYRYLTQDMGLPHDLAIALMGNVVEESRGDYKAVQKNGGGRGLIQWDGLPAPSSRYGLWGKIWASVAKPANVYDKATDTVKNYWAPYNGLKGEQVRLEFIKAPLKKKAEIYAKSALRSGKLRIPDRQLSTMQLDSVYNPKIKNIVLNKEGGIIKAQEGTKTSWWRKGLDFLNESGLGKTLVEGGLSFLLNSSQNKSISGATDVAKAELDKEKQEASDYALLMATKKALEMLLIDPNNPNAFGGSIVLDLIRLQLYNAYLNPINLNFANKKALLDMLSLLMLNENTSGTISGILLSGLGLVFGNFLGPKKSSSTTNNNSTTTNNLLNYNNIGKSTNPYMNTNLGGFVNNPTNKFFWAPSVKD